MRAVLDTNVLVAALLSPRGTPARILSAWSEGRFELVVSDALLDELARALAYDKLRERVTSEEAEAFLALIRETARHVADVPSPPRRSADPDDDFLVALASSSRAMLVTGDAHLLELAGPAPVHAPRPFLELLAGNA